MALVLVTGGSGFVGAHVIVALLKSGHQVRTTIRDLAREEAVRDLIREGGVEPGEQLEFAAADLERDDGWAAAVAGCDYVLHVASPFPARQPEDEDELIRPAREGTLRVLRAARDAGVKRVVVTSSFAAIGYGHKPRREPFTEADWTDLSGPGVSPYIKSKTLAERAAWDFVVAEGRGMELSVVNPVAILGPVLGPDLSSSIVLVKGLMEGAMPALPRVYFGIVDVRDLADLHLLAMTRPEAAGERFLAVAGDSVSLRDAAQVVRHGLPDAAAKVPTREMPDWLVRVLGLFNPQAREMAGRLGDQRNATADKARRLLGWTPRSSAEAILATAESLVQRGLVT